MVFVPRSRRRRRLPLTSRDIFEMAPTLPLLLLLGLGFLGAAEARVRAQRYVEFDPPRIYPESSYQVSLWHNPYVCFCYSKSTS